MSPFLLPLSSSLPQVSACSSSSYCPQAIPLMVCLALFCLRTIILKILLIRSSAHPASCSSSPPLRALSSRGHFLPLSSCCSVISFWSSLGDAAQTLATGSPWPNQVRKQQQNPQSQNAQGWRGKGEEDRPCSSTWGLKVVRPSDNFKEGPRNISPGTVFSWQRTKGLLDLLLASPRVSPQASLGHCYLLSWCDEWLSRGGFILVLKKFQLQEPHTCTQPVFLKQSPLNCVSSGSHHTWVCPWVRESFSGT